MRELDSLVVKLVCGCGLDGWGGSRPVGLAYQPHQADLAWAGRLAESSVCRMGFRTSESDLVDTGMRAVLDTAQAGTAFIHLVQVVMLMGIRSGPGILVTLGSALSPSVRLTSCGIPRRLRSLRE